MVKFKALTSSVKTRFNRPLNMDLRLFSSFSNTTLIVWLNDFFHGTFIINVIIVCKDFITTITLIFKKIANYCKYFMLLK